MKNAILSLSILVLLFISSCCSNQTVTCTRGRLGIRLVGTFLTGTPLIVRYTQDNAFDVIVDTLVGSFDAIVGTDTAYLAYKSIDSTRPDAYMVTDSFGSGLVLGYDYKLLFPQDSLTWSITNLTAAGPDQVEIKHCPGKDPVGCTKNAQSCAVNGTTVTSVVYPGPGPQTFAYINLAR